MTTTPTKARPGKRPARVRTAAALKADASLLTGTPSRSRAALAALDDEAPPVDQEVTTAELWLYGVVGGWWYGFNADTVSRALRTIDADVIYVRIHSPGGLASDGVAIGNLFRNHTARIVVVVDGLAASAASVIAIAGDEIVMCPGSQMMLHDASTFEYGNAGAHRKIATWLDGQSQNYASVYAGKAGGTTEQWREVMLAEDGWGTWYTAEDAVAAGLADSVGTRPATGSPPTAPDEDDAFDEDDDDLLARVEHDLQLLEQAVHPAALAAWQGSTPDRAPQRAPKSPNASAGGSPNTEGGSAVAFSDEQLNTLRSKLGLPETADEAAITAAVTTVVTENEELAADTPAASTKVPDGMKLVSATVFDDVTAKAQRGADAAEELLTLKTEAFLDRHKAKFPPTPEAKAKWAADFKRDPDGTEAYLSAAAALVPTGELGHGDAPEGSAKSTATLAEVRQDAAYKSWEI